MNKQNNIKKNKTFVLEEATLFFSIFNFQFSIFNFQFSKTYFIYFNLTSIFHKIEIDFTPFYIGKKQEQDAKEQ